MEKEEAPLVAELFKKQLELLDNGILTVDDKARIIFFNSRFTDLWKIPQDIFAAKDGEKVLEYGLKLLKDSDDLGQEIANIRKNMIATQHEIEFLDGRFFNVHSSPILENGKYLGRIWSFQDITIQKNAQLETIKKNQELLELNDELVKLNAQKDKLFSIIAHDLGTPFNSILGFSKLLVDDLDNYNSDEIKQFADMLYVSASNIHQLLNNLLDWSRAKIGHTQLKPEKIFLDEVVINAINLYRESAKIKKIVLKSMILNNVIIWYDKNMLETIIRNLISNAIKYCREGDRITVSANRASDNLIQFSVADTGIGMDPQRLASLFEIDADIKRVGTKGEPSSGLGLKLCKEFVEKNFGKIWAESEEEKGSTFFFTIPIVPGS